MKYCRFLIVLMFYSATSPAQVVLTRDIDYIDDSEYENDKDLLDIYMPQDAKDVPVIVYFHGGALIMGDKSWGEDIGNKIARSGMGLVSVNYRLSPEFQHPAHVKDAAAATAWVYKNIKNYGGNPQKLYVGGHSAGAYLAALLTMDSTHLAAGLGDSKLAGAVLISPFLYVEETAKDRIQRDTIYKTIWGADPMKWKQASVSPHIRANRDNILLIYADGDEDWRKEQNERFARTMRSVGNHRIFTKEVPDRTHTSLLSSILEKDDQIVRLITDFVLNE